MSRPPLKPYTNYRESGLPGIGSIPSHWGSTPGFGAYKEKQVRNSGMQEKTILSLSYGRIVVKPENRLTGLVPESFETYQIIEPGDIVIRATDLQNDKTSLRVGFVRNRGIITSAYLTLQTTSKLLPEYGYLLIHALDLTKMLYGLGSGLRQNLSYADFKRLPIFVPAPDEQAAIVRYLDWACGRLDRAIRANRKIMSLLNEQKQAIVTSAVLGWNQSGSHRSINENPFLKKTPEQWPLFRAKFLFRQVVPGIPENAEIVTCFRDGQVTLRKNRRTTGFTNAIWELGYQGIVPGQLVLHSMDAFAGAIGVSDSHGKCSPEYVICEPRITGIVPEYYGLLLRTLAIRGMFVALCPSVRERAPRVRFSDFSSFILPKPPELEQHTIVQRIRESCAWVDRSLHAVQEQAGLLDEYRTRLIADVVTGKLDVREAAANLPIDESLEAIEEAGAEDEEELAEELAEAEN